MYIGVGDVRKGFNGSAVCTLVMPGYVKCRVVDGVIAYESTLTFQQFTLGYFMVLDNAYIIGLDFSANNGVMSQGCVEFQGRYVCDITEEVYRCKSILDLIPDIDKSILERGRVKNEWSLTSDGTKLWYPRRKTARLSIISRKGNYALLGCENDTVVDVVGVVPNEPFHNIEALPIDMRYSYYDEGINPRYDLRKTVGDCKDLIINGIFPGITDKGNIFYAYGINTSYQVDGCIIDAHGIRRNFSCDRVAWCEGYPQFLDR